MPQHLKPFLYEIEIQLFIGTTEVYGNKSFTTEGQTQIHFNCVTPTNYIYLHSEELVLNTEKLRINSEEDLEIDLLDKNAEYDLEKNFVIFKLNKQCKKNANYKLSISYTGLILPYTYGLYKSSYTDKTGKTF